MPKRTYWHDGKTIKELKMVSNGSFNAYLMEERPKLRRVRQRVGNWEKFC